MTKRVTTEPTAASDPVGQARDLAEHLQAGGELVPWSRTVVPLDDGELQFAQLGAFGARWYGYEDVQWESRTFIAGGPLMMCATAAASVAGNSMRRRAARSAAMPQWRPLGWMPIAVTSDRLLVGHLGTLHSVWYSAIRRTIPEADPTGLQLLFEADAPYRLAGPDVPTLGVLLESLLTRQCHVSLA